MRCNLAAIFGFHSGIGELDAAECSSNYFDISEFLETFGPASFDLSNGISHQFFYSVAKVRVEDEGECCKKNFSTKIISY